MRTVAVTLAELTSEVIRLRSALQLVAGLLDSPVSAAHVERCRDIIDDALDHDSDDAPGAAAQQACENGLLADLECPPGYVRCPHCRTIKPANRPRCLTCLHRA